MGQYGRWSLSERQVRMTVNPTTSMSSDRCMDALLDWGTEGTGHWDSRILRSCQPGYAVETDPGGDGFWEEPNNNILHWRDLGGIQKGWGYTIDDDSLEIAPGSANRDPFDSAGHLAPDNPAARAGARGYARIKSRLQSGSVKSCNPLPAWSSDGSGGCD